MDGSLRRGLFVATKVMVGGVKGGGDGDPMFHIYIQARYNPSLGFNWKIGRTGLLSSHWRSLCWDKGAIYVQRCRESLQISKRTDVRMGSVTRRDSKSESSAEHHRWCQAGTGEELTISGACYSQYAPELVLSGSQRMDGWTLVSRATSGHSKSARSQPRTAFAAVSGPERTGAYVIINSYRLDVR